MFEIDAFESWWVGSKEVKNHSGLLDKQFMGNDEVADSDFTLFALEIDFVVHQF